MSDPIDELIEWLDKAIKHHETLLSEDEEIITSNVWYLNYAGILSGFRLARTQAWKFKKHSDEAESRLNQILDALVLLGIHADSLFDRIKRDLDRGLIQEARVHLNFVDEMIRRGGLMAGASEKIQQGWQVLREKWDSEGQCLSCGWHALLSEHKVEDIDIKEAIESDGILYLECLSKDDEEHRHSHRGIKINLRTQP